MARELAVMVLIGAGFALQVLIEILWEWWLALALVPPESCGAPYFWCSFPESMTLR